MVLSNALFLLIHFCGGGRYNPILPLYKQIPKQLRDDLGGSKVQDLFYGSLDFFQPDFLVLCDGIDESDIKAPPCEILQLEDITKNISQEHRPGCGVGVSELLQHYYAEEEKFVRKDKIEYILPNYGQNHRCFLKSIFGDFPEELSAKVRENIIEDFDAQEASITMAKYLEFLHDGTLNLHKLTSYKIDIDYASNAPRDRYVIYYLDPSSLIDIVSYVNLKAAGYNVLPIAKQIAHLDETKEVCLGFINENSWVHPQYPDAKEHVTLQKSPSVGKAELEKFYKYLSPPKFEDDGWSRCIMRHWLPQFWSQFHLERGEVYCAQLTVAKREDEVPIRDERGISVSTLLPDFISDRMLLTVKPRYAIDIATWNYSSTDFEAGIMPSGSDDVARSCRMFDKREWLIKRSGITYFSSFKSMIYFDAPKAQDVFLGWLKSQGWEAEISDAGKVAYQMLRHLDGPWRIMMMKSRKFVETFSGKLFANDKSIKAGPFIYQVTKGIYDDLRISWGEDKFLKALLNCKIVKLGTTLQCDTCSRHSWHPINALDYIVQCPHCLSDFEIPTHEPGNIKWSYKTIGPFAARGRAAGSYSVLLTAHFFENEMRNSGDTTTVLSFTAKRGSEKFEADLALFYCENTFFDRTLETVFCECKTFNHFSKEDVEKMYKIAKEFPGAILVFATLNDDLNDDEKALITPLVRSCNKYHERGRPINPVMILTGVELFSDYRPPYAWEKKDGKYKKFGKGSHIRSLLEICRATQELYLDLDPWNEDWKKMWAKRRAKTSDTLQR